MGSKNFKYLDELIHSGIKEIVLDSDIVLSDDEELQYLEGIKLDVDDLIINGNGHRIDSQGKTRIFHCTGKNIAIENIILKNGYAKRDGGAIVNVRGGLSITHSAFAGNIGKWSGAIYNKGGELSVADSTFTGNTTKGNGGAIHNFDGGLTITESTFTGNTASYGGAIRNDWGELTITESTLTGNTAHRYGGAINNDEGELTITESTLQQNTAKNGDGGAIHNNWGGELTITKSTLQKTPHKKGMVEQYTTIGVVS